MARTTINPIVPVGPYPTLPVTANSLDVVFTASDVANGNIVPFGTYSRILLVVRNTNAGAQTVTFGSAVDTLNRTGDVTAYSLAASEFGAFIFARNGWRQSDGGLYLNGSHANIEFAAFALT